jgi:hypothetical protein
VPAVQNEQQECDLPGWSWANPAQKRADHRQHARVPEQRVRVIAERRAREHGMIERKQAARQRAHEAHLEVVRHPPREGDPALGHQPRVLPRLTLGELVQAQAGAVPLHVEPVDEHVVVGHEAHVERRQHEQQPQADGSGEEPATLQPGHPPCHHAHGGILASEDLAA